MTDTLLKNLNATVDTRHGASNIYTTDVTLSLVIAYLLDAGYTLCSSTEHKEQDDNGSENTIVFYNAADYSYISFDPFTKELVIS